MKPALITIQRMQILAWLMLGLAFGFLTLRALHFDDEVAFLPTQQGGPVWIAAPLPVTANLIAQDPQDPPESVFVRTFTHKEPGTEATLNVRALREARVRLNGLPLEIHSDNQNWRAGFSLDLGPHLQPGSNRLEIGVKRADGPALLQATILQEQGQIQTDSAWQVITPGNPAVPAWRAQDQGLHPEARVMPTPGQIVTRKAPWLVGLFLLSALGAVLYQRRDRIPENAPRTTLIGISLLWIGFFFFKVSDLPVEVGFDATGHLAYIDYLRDQLQLPSAAYGFATYHPPAFYILAAFASHTGEWLLGPSAETIALHLLTFFSGWMNVVFTAWTARRLWPGEALRPSLAIAAAGLLPMNLYMSAYVSNEPFHAALISGCMTLAAALLLSKKTRTWQWVLLTLGLGLAILTKFTSLVIAPVIAFFVSLRLWWIEDKSPTTSVLRFGWILVGCAGIGGWFYLGNYLAFGDPFVWNLDVPGAPTWWLRPGFHTSAWYLGFGESLHHPYFAGYVSFWDGLYSTFWGDGLVGGMARIETRHGFWNDDFQTLIYPLALPATVLGWLGYFRLGYGSFREADLGRRLYLSLLTSLLALLGFSLFLISLELPYYAQAKSFYILAGLLPLSLSLAEGLGWAAETMSKAQRPAVTGLYFGWLGLLAGTIAIAFAG
ncbi:MAG: ArnT family glycosyltransferase [Myxococcota bacterium]